MRLSRISNQIHDQPLSLDATCARLEQRKLEIGTVVDIGASNGSWSQIMRRVYPQAYFLLIEANAYHEEGLIAFKRNNTPSDYVLAVAGDELGEIFFDKSDPFGGVASHEESEKFDSCLPCVTVDDEVSKRNLRGPFLLKLDTHGFEMPIFSGAEETLKSTNLIFVETYNFDIEKTSLRFWEMCQFLYEKGFRPIDMCQPIHRPKDGAFWQMDILFVRSDRKEFQSNSHD
jgi:FkbM family methyltransferase